MPKPTRHDPHPSKLTIDTIVACIAEDATGEGLAAFNVGGTMMPLIAADEARLESILPLARHLAAASGQRINVVKFSVRELLEVIEP